MRNPPAQCAILVARNFRVLAADRPTLFVALALAPLMAALICLTFASFQLDGRKTDQLAQAVHFFHQHEKPFESRGATVQVDDVARQVRAAMESETRLIGEETAQRRAAVYFVLVSAALWLGLMGSCREIVHEQHVLHREAHADVGLLPYLLAKFFVQATVTGLQTAVLAAAVSGGLLDGTTLAAAARLWGWLWLTAVSAVSLGLVVSAFSYTVRVALTVVPLIMIAQLLLGGFLRPAGADRPGGRICDALGSVAIQRWGFEAALTTDRYAGDGVVSLRYRTLDFEARYGIFNIVGSETRSLPSLFFGKPSAMAGPFLAGLTLLHLAVAWGAIRRRFL